MNSMIKPSYHLHSCGGFQNGFTKRTLSQNTKKMLIFRKLIRHNEQLKIKFNKTIATNDRKLADKLKNMEKEREGTSLKMYNAYNITQSQPQEALVDNCKLVDQVKELTDAIK